MDYLRLLRLGGGIFCFALGAVGAVVPGLPTTVFVLAGSYLLTRSCPRLERRLRLHPLFRGCAPYLDPTMPIPRRARVVAIASMWTSLGLSTTVACRAGVGGSRTIASMLAAGAAGTVAILVFRRSPRSEHPQPAVAQG